jgi:hypothetical protein
MLRAASFVAHRLIFARRPPGLPLCTGSSAIGTSGQRWVSGERRDIDDGMRLDAATMQDTIIPPGGLTALSATIGPDAQIHAVTNHCLLLSALGTQPPVRGHCPHRHRLQVRVALCVCVLSSPSSSSPHRHRLQRPLRAR